LPARLSQRLDLHTDRADQLVAGSWRDGFVESADPLPALQRPAHAIDGSVQQPTVGRELLQRADFAAGADDRHEIAWRDHRIHVARQHLPDVSRALERQTEIVDDDGQDAGGALGRCQPAAAGERPRPGRVARRCGRRSRPRRRLRRRPAIRADDLDIERLSHGLAPTALDDVEVVGLQIGDVLALLVDDDCVDGRKPGGDPERGRIGWDLRLLAREDGKSTEECERGGHEAPRCATARMRATVHRDHRISKSAPCDACRPRLLPDCGAKLTCSV
jgi:hypothetical protein